MKDHEIVAAIIANVDKDIESITTDLTARGFEVVGNPIIRLRADGKESYVLVISKDGEINELSLVIDEAGIVVETKKNRKARETTYQSNKIEFKDIARYR